MRELVFRAIRRSGEPPGGRPRRRWSGWPATTRKSPRCSTGRRTGRRRIGSREEGSGGRVCCRNGSSTNCRRWSTPDEWPALLERAPLDLRANVARTSREAMVDAFEGAGPTPLSPWGLRLPADSRVDQHPAFIDGLVEVQDEGSQLIALACGAAAGSADRRSVRGRGRQSAGAGRGRGREAEIIACDTSRARL